MQSFKSFIIENTDDDVVFHYHRVPKKTTPHGKGSSLVTGLGLVKSKDGKTLVSMYHHNDGHTYLYDHDGGIALKSNRPVHHTIKQIVHSYARANGEPVENYKTN